MTKGRMEAFSDTRAGPRRERDGHGLALGHEEIPQVRIRTARQQLHRDEAVLTGDAELERLDDIGMRELREDLGLVDEHALELLVLSKLVADHLERNSFLGAIVALGAADVDRRHSPAADLGAHLVLPQQLWRGECRHGPHDVLKPNSKDRRGWNPRASSSFERASSAGQAAAE